MNKRASRDALYYGTVIFDSDISVKGNQSKPIITMQAELDKGTNLALVLPESELAVEERNGIVDFIDVNTPPNSIMFRQNPGTNEDTAVAKLSSIDFTSNISRKQGFETSDFDRPCCGRFTGDPGRSDFELCD